MKTNYSTKKLGEVAILNPEKSEIKDKPGSLLVSFVSMSAVDEYLQTITQLESRKIGAVRKGYTYFRNDDVLFAKITPCMENGKVAIARGLENGIGFGSTEFHVIRPTDQITSEWIYLVVGNQAFRDEAEKRMQGVAGQRRVPISFLENYEILVPPIVEQRKIVARIEKQFAKIDEVARLRAESEKLAAALLPAALHEIFSDHDWEMVNIGDEKIMKMTSGGTPSRGNVAFYDGENVWLKSGELNDDTELMDSEEHISNEALKKSSAKIFPAGTVLLAMYGATAGKLGILKRSGATNQAVAGMTPVSSKLDSKYLFYCLLHIREEIIGQAWGGAQPNLSQTILKKIKIPLPPLAEQKKIVQKLDALSIKSRTLRDLQSSQSADLKSLKQSILHEAFS